MFWGQMLAKPYSFVGARIIVQQENSGEQNAIG
jgi:hypothetical protein